MAKLQCNSCKADISIVKDSTKFPCPGCVNEVLVRCGKCRQISTRYKCKACGFEGP